MSELGRVERNIEQREFIGAEGVWECKGEIVARLRAAGCVFAEDEAALLVEATNDADVLGALVAQRVSGVPLEYLLGWAEFRGVRVGVRAGVFVPRQRTAFLVDIAIESAREAALTLVDLCCGTGALGLTATSELRANGKDVALSAADIDPVAVACARDNLAGIGDVHEGDLFAALPPHLRGHIDLLLANTPYVPTAHLAALPPEARDHEPPHALDGGIDGLAIFRRVIDGAVDWLAPGGRVLVEMSADQGELAADVITRAGMRARIERSAEYYATVVVGTR
ncbi:putative protein N(5)-glutamine methyltransferase [Nocardia camponoti]|nr:putative protein N(5)-glutamine methyltransferase [Nocardia camponoti]